MKSAAKLDRYWPFWLVAVCICYWWVGPFPLFSQSLWSHYIPPLWQMSDGAIASHFSHVTQLLLFWILAAGIGRIILQRFIGLENLNPFESVAYGFGLGAIALAYAVLALASFRVLNSITVVTTTALLLIFSLIFNRDLFSKKMNPARLKNTPRIFVVATILIVWVLFLYGFYALTPETFYDSLVYHIGLPQLYKDSGGFVATPHNFYSGLPFLMQMLYTWALFLSDEILAKLIHWSMGAGLAIGFVGLCTRFKTPAPALLLACAFLTTPIFGINVTVSAVDVASSFFVFLSVYALSISVVENEKRPDSWQLMSAIFCGFSLALKYTNWPLLLILSVALLLTGRNKNSILRFGVVALLFVLPCVIRNLVFYGNPIYPYFHEWFEENPFYAVDWRGFQSDVWAKDWSNILTHPNLIGEAILHPLLLTFRGSSSVDYVGPLFLAALPLVFFGQRNNSHRVFLIAFTGLWLTWWLTTNMARYFLPGLAVLAACFCLRFPTYEKRWIRWAISATFVAIIFHNTAGFSVFPYRIDSWNYLIHGEDRPEYLGKPHVGYPSPYFASSTWINTHAAPDSKVFVIGDGRGAYIERPFLAVVRWSSDPLYFWLRQSKTAADLKQVFDREGIRYLLINIAEITRRPNKVSLTSKDVEVLETFFRLHTTPRFADRVDPWLRWTEVWEIVPSATNPPERKYSLVEWFRYQSNLSPQRH